MSGKKRSSRSKSTRDAKKKHKRNTIIVLVIVVLSAIGLVGNYFYGLIYKSNTQTLKGGSFTLYIPNNATFQQVKDSLTKNNVLKNVESFDKIAEWKEYSKNIKAGRYVIKEGASNNALINKLRLGAQDAVKVVIFGVRKKEELAGKVSKRLDFDSTEILSLLNNEQYLMDNYGFTPDNILTMFIPNTYQVFWNTTAYKFMDRMYGEYKFFWNGKRRAEAEKIGLSPIEVSVLASIVQSESNVNSDKPIIAGVYLNRIHKGMPLEADPTLVWALNDFSIKRVLNIHKQIESPYNTYKYKGLPPGPITLPSKESIDAVLNRQEHRYLYFCAREDFSGHSSFAESYEEHLENARRYQKALTKKGIMR